MALQFKYLIRVEPGANNNKFYKMQENADGTFTATYGRVGAAKPATEIYSMSKWGTKLNEKLSSRKGYTDHTELFAEVKTATGSTGNVVADDAAVANLIIALQNYAKANTAATYLVQAEQVTQAQIDRAQTHIDNLSYSLRNHFGKNWNFEAFNRELVALYMVIPRKMKHVSDHLISATTKKEEIEKIIGDEQSNLDTMASQVISNTSTTEDTDKDHTLVQSLGLDIKLVTDSKELEMVKKHAQEHAKRVLKVYKVVNKITQTAFDKHLAKAVDKKTQLLWHGSRNQNWWWIIQQGLKIRPSNAGYNGSMFDDGVYAAREADKSMGYTDNGRWINGSARNSVFMALFDFHLGKQKIVTRHDSSCYKLASYCKSNGYDSVWAQKGPSLYRDEYIVYNSNQCTIKYLIEFSA